MRLHTDHQANEAAQSIGARAFTVGTDIAFDQNRFSAARTEDQHLLAHELAHVVQQGQASGLFPDHLGGNDFAPAPPQAEQAADAAATAIASGESAPAQPAQPIQVGREPPYQPYPAPIPGAYPMQGPPPPMPEKEKQKTEAPAPTEPEKEKTPAKKRTPVGTNGSFKDNSPTAAVRKMGIRRLFWIM